MNFNEQTATGLIANLGLLKMTLADFSDDDLLVRPVEGANHANWQLGHLVAAETNMLKGAGAAMPELPPGFVEKYTNAAAAGNSPAQFATRDELLRQLETTRSATAAFARAATAAQLDAASPERIRMLAPTVADLLILVSVHTAMHVGQFQVIRRKLGKPVLF